MNTTQHLSDLDHVVLSNGKTYRVLGNLRNNTYFWGYNVYSPHKDGDRMYLGTPYRKNYLEDEQLPLDVLETYEVIPLSEIVVRLDPMEAAQRQYTTFHNTIWFDLYERLQALFGANAVGIFGSSMFGLHLTPEGHVRKDIDFVIEGLHNVGKLQRALPGLRDQLGFHEVSEARQLQQYQRYQRVFQGCNTIREIIKRRWTGLQLSKQIVSTLRFRDPSVTLPLELIQNATILQKNAVITGKVRDAERSNLFPRFFYVEAETGVYPVYIMWWKFSTPVRDHDSLTLCGDTLQLAGQEVLRVTHFRDHWLAFDGKECNEGIL